MAVCSYRKLYRETELHDFYFNRLCSNAAIRKIKFLLIRYCFRHIIKYFMQDLIGSILKYLLIYFIFLLNRFHTQIILHLGEWLPSVETNGHISLTWTQEYIFTQVQVK